MQTSLKEQHSPSRKAQVTKRWRQMKEAQGIPNLWPHIVRCLSLRVVWMILEYFGCLWATSTDSVKPAEFHELKGLSSRASEM